MMREAYQVVDAWGFHPDTVLTWCKPGLGLGGGFRGNTEHLIVARRGLRSLNPTCDMCGGRARGARKCGCNEPAWRVNGVVIGAAGFPLRPFRSLAAGTWYRAKRQEHSRKPSLFMDLIEQMSPGPYLEMFARPPHRLGWDVWGNESANTASLEAAGG
jgi:N6-adenosine-specific RNA methylase IME4